MTHSAHRQGSYSGLRDDFVVLAVPAGDSQNRGAALDKFIEIGRLHGPVHVPEAAPGTRHLVYDTKGKLRDLLAGLAAAELGLSITVSGLRDQVRECCHEVGLRPHTVLDSFGFLGKTEQLPPFKVLEITTMCGHGRVPPNLVWHLAQRVRAQKTSPAEASEGMGKLCLCRIFNEVRAARLLRALAADLQAGTLSEPEHALPRDMPAKPFGVAIDEDTCISCGDCVPYCPVSAIVESPADGPVRIDAQRCTECGLCLQSAVCPVVAIIARDLGWPRTLRGKFQNHHSLYRDTPLMAQVSPPLNYAGNGKVFHLAESPGELRNDVNGLIRPGEAEIVAELGRPHLAATFRDVQKLVQALLPLGLQLNLQYPPADQRTPLSLLASDVARGIFRRDILDERLGWVILRLHGREEEVPGVLQVLRQAATEIDTVFAVGVVSRVAKDGSAGERAASEIGLEPAVNCKINVGLGRPLSV